MRVVAGTAGGRRLRGPASEATRPTTDKVRGAVFNVLESMNVIEGASVLDLFAGTGACGIEALSRGAASATFVDRNGRALRVVRENLDTVGLLGEVVQADVVAFVKKRRSFDVAIADPPYDFEAWQEILDNLDVDVLVCEARIVVAASDGWTSVRERRYGDTMVTILRRDR